MVNCAGVSPSLQPKHLRHSSSQLIHSHLGVNLDSVQFQTLRFLVQTLSEHGVAFKQVAKRPLRVACLGDKSPLRTAATIYYSLTKLGGRDEPDSVTTHGE